MNASRVSLFIGGAFLLSACGKTMIDGEGWISDAPTTVVLTVSDKAEELGWSRTTESGSVDEQRIKSIEVWVFRAAGQAEAGSLVKYISPGTNETTVTFVMNGGIYDFYVVANQQVGTQENKNDLLSKVCSYTITPANSRAVSSAGLPMTGASTGYVLDGAQSSHQISMSLKRRAAKFESPTAAAGLKVTLSDASGLNAILPGVEYDFETPNLDFTLTGFVLANGIDKSWLFGADLRGTDWSLPAGAAYQLSTFETDGSYAGVYSGGVEIGPPMLYFLDPNLPQADRPVVYAYENFPVQKTVDGITGYDRKEVYAMILRGTVSQTGTPANSTTRYWRINLVRGTSSAPQNYKIMENKLYRIHIDEIRSLGYATPQEAESESASLPLILPSEYASMTVSCRVEEWDDFPEGVIL